MVCAYLSKWHNFYKYNLKSQGLLWETFKMNKMGNGVKT